MSAPRCLVHLVGSMALANPTEVIETSAAILGDRVKRLSNGETGVSKDWIIGHLRLFERHPDFEEFVHLETADPRTPNHKRRRFRLKDGVRTPTAASFGATGYVQDALEAHGIINRLKREGKVTPATKLLVTLPSPYDILNFTVAKGDFRKILPVYEELLLGEAQKIGALIPAQDLAIQWDAAHEFEYLATSSPVFNHMTREEMVAMLTRLGKGSPAQAELGYHCCYGNFQLRHFVEPRDMGDMVDVMNKIIAGVGRPIAFVHMPVPIARDDDAYFAPLKDLRLQPGTEFYLGMTHDKDGVPGILRRAATARRHVRDFGISTECGLAMREAENVREILRIEAQACAELDRIAGV